MTEAEAEAATTILRAARWVDVAGGQVATPAVVLIEGNRISAVNPEGPLPDSATVIDLGDATLLPGLMDMELNLLIGGPGNPAGLPTPMHGVQDDPAYRTLRGAVNARTTLDAGFTTVRNLGLMVKTGGYLLDVALQRAIDQGWHQGRASSRPVTPSRPMAGTSIPRCSSGWHRASCRCRSPRASPTECRMSSHASATRSATAPS